MTLEFLQNEKNKAIKSKDVFLREALTGMIDTVQKASITSKGRVEITEQLVNETLIKYQKTIQEMVDTCPPDRERLLAKYQYELDVVKQYAPQLMSDPTVIEEIIYEILEQADIAPLKENKGKIMKVISPHFKGVADMKIVSQVVTDILI